MRMKNIRFELEISSLKLNKFEFFNRIRIIKVV